MEDPKDSNMEDPKNKAEEEKVSEDQKDKEPFMDGELIYNEEKGNQDMEKLFNDEEGAEYDTYEIEFKILDQNKQPNKQKEICNITARTEKRLLPTCKRQW